MAAVGFVGLVVGGLAVGYEPVGGDPDCMYRPIKAELSRALRAGGLPLWSDRFGVGTPLAAESHVAAFYPPNWFAYGLLDHRTAYRLMMWAHFVALAASTYAYGRTLGLTAEGGALAALSFTLCGFQAGHACHEPFYHLLPYLPLTLLCAERYLREGRVAWLAGLALALGAQFTLGHFQIQCWTAGLVVLTGLWRAGRGVVPRRRLVGLALALGWAAAVAAPQLALTWELTRFTGFDRPIKFLTNYSFPPAHWAQLALPSLFQGFREGRESRYWDAQATISDEACLYVGTVPLVLAAVGYVARGDRSLGLWRWLCPLGFALATMPRWWLEGFQLLLNLPVLGQFRAPGRYTLLTSLGLCLLAGRGLDRAIPAARFRLGVALAAAFGLAGLAWGYEWSARPDVRAELDDSTRLTCLAGGAAAWAVALGAVAVWRSGRSSAWLPMAVAGSELAFLFYHGPTTWGRTIRFPDDSPMLRRLAAESGVGVVAGWLRNVPVGGGFDAADSYLGITPPPPNYLLDAAAHPGSAAFDYRFLMPRYGVTHGVFEAGTHFLAGETLARGADPVLDRVLPRLRQTPARRLWKLERYGPTWPAARAAIEVRRARDWYELLPALCREARPGPVWFYPGDEPPTPPGPRARSARVVRWDSRSGVVEHDGTCDLVLRRPYYPGWTASLDGGPDLAVSRADGNVQGVRLPGSGRTRVELRYRPASLPAAAGVSLASALAAAGVLAAAALRRQPEPGGSRG